jgi:hypothetical protein
MTDMALDGGLWSHAGAVEILYTLAWSHICHSFVYAITNYFSTKQARWPSGLRRQLKVLPIRWSERAWVQIPLSSISLLFCFALPQRIQKGGGMGLKSIFCNSGLGICAGLFLCVKPSATLWRLGALCMDICACAVIRA